MFRNGKIFILMKYDHLDLFYVLDYSGSVDMHVKNVKKKIKKMQKSANKRLRTLLVTDPSVTFRFSFAFHHE